MATKSRYAGYAKAVQSIKEKQAVTAGNNKKKTCAGGSTPVSILEKLKSLKNQEFIMNVPMGGTDGD